MVTKAEEKWTEFKMALKFKEFGEKVSHENKENWSTADKNTWTIEIKKRSERDE
jgi:hypothetical protein